MSGACVSVQVPCCARARGAEFVSAQSATENFLFQKLPVSANSPTRRGDERNAFVHQGTMVSRLAVIATRTVFVAALIVPVSCNRIGRLLAFGNTRRRRIRLAVYRWLEISPCWHSLCQRNTGSKQHCRAGACRYQSQLLPHLLSLLQYLSLFRVQLMRPE